MIFAIVVALILAACNCRTTTNEEPTMIFNEEIALVQPRKVAGLSINEALALRKSYREYADTTLSLQEISEVLWAAVGVNRPDGKRTSPSALAIYPVQVFAFFAEGVYRYNVEKHTLERVAEGDFRPLTATQDFAYSAPLNLVYIADFDKYKNGRGAGIAAEKVLYLCGQDAAGYAENVNLYCAGHGMKAITRGSAKNSELLQMLNLDSTRYGVVLAQTVGK